MALDIPEDARWDKDALEEAALDEFMEQCRPHLDIGRGQDVTENQLEKGCRSVLRKLVGFRENHFFEEDLDQFESFLQEQIAALNEYKHGTFPVGDADLDNVDHRDLIIQ
jgi:hypothetical protein